jgi:hypothetical protein
LAVPRTPREANTSSSVVLPAPAWSRRVGENVRKGVGVIFYWLKMRGSRSAQLGQ